MEQVSNPSGFTLIELITVLLITVVIATSAALLIPSSASMQAPGFAKVFADDLQLTSMLSISGNQRYRLVIGGNAYQILDQTGSAITLPETNTTTMTFPTGLTITPTITIAFDGLGQPYTLSMGNYTLLAAVQSFSVTSDGNTATVSLTPQTGYVQ